MTSKKEELAEAEAARHTWNDAKTKKTKLDGEVTRKQNIRKSLRPFK